LEEEAVLWKEIGDGLGAAIPIMDLGCMALSQGNYLEAEKHFQKSLKIYKEAGSKPYIFQILRYLGATYRGLNQYEQAERVYSECIQYAQAIGWDFATSIMYLGFSFIGLNTNDLAKAENNLLKCLFVCKKYTESYHSHPFHIPEKYDVNGRIVLCIAGFASLAVHKKLPKLAARFFGAYFMHYEEYCKDIFISSVTLNDVEHYFNLCREQLSDDEFSSAWSAGSTLTLDDVIEELMAMLP
jgi:tetratricopeptide (TPR) repeat protein